MILTQECVQNCPLGYILNKSKVEDEYYKVRRSRKQSKKKKKINDIQLLQKENNNTFYILGQDQEKYLHENTNIIYTDTSNVSMVNTNNSYSIRYRYNIY